MQLTFSKVLLDYISTFCCRVRWWSRLPRNHRPDSWSTSFAATSGWPKTRGKLWYRVTWRWVRGLPSFSIESTMATMAGLFRATKILMKKSHIFSSLSGCQGGKVKISTSAHFWNLKMPTTNNVNYDQFVQGDQNIGEKLHIFLKCSQRTCQGQNCQKTTSKFSLIVQNIYIETPTLET